MNAFVPPCIFSPVAPHGLQSSAGWTLGDNHGNRNLYRALLQGIACRHSKRLLGSNSILVI